MPVMCLSATQTQVPTIFLDSLSLILNRTNCIKGAVPCHLVDFSDVTTARQFHVKVENLYYEYLQHQCNRVSSYFG